MSQPNRLRVVAEMDAWLTEQQRAVSLLKSVDADVIDAAVECFESHLQAGRFLTSPARSLAESIPAEVASTEEGKQRVLNLIRAIDYGVYL